MKALLLSTKMITPYYQDDWVTLYNADCVDVLPHLSKVDLVLTDPPYGIGASKGFGVFRGFGGSGEPIAAASYDDSWDDTRPPTELLNRMIKIAPLSIIAGGNYFADVLPISTHWLVWDKLQTMPTFSDCELFWTNSPRKSVKKYTVQWNGLLGKELHQERVHPTQKPEKLFSLIIQDYSSDGQTILDPFAGSGTTLRAAKNLRRKSIGIEREEKYCKEIVKRLRQEVLL